MSTSLLLVTVQINDWMGHGTCDNKTTSVSTRTTAKLHDRQTHLLIHHQAFQILSVLPFEIKMCSQP